MSAVPKYDDSFVFRHMEAIRDFLVIVFVLTLVGIYIVSPLFDVDAGIVGEAIAIAFASTAAAAQIFLGDEPRNWQIIEASLERAKSALGPYQSFSELIVNKSQFATELIEESPGRDIIRQHAIDIGRRLASWEPEPGQDPRQKEFMDDINALLTEIRAKHPTKGSVHPSEFFEIWAHSLVSPNGSSSDLPKLVAAAENMPNTVAESINETTITSPVWLFRLARPNYITLNTHLDMCKILENPQLQTSTIEQCVEAILPWLNQSNGWLAARIVQVLERQDLGNDLRAEVLTTVDRNGLGAAGFAWLGRRGLEATMKLPVSLRNRVMKGRLHGQADDILDLTIRNLDTDDYETRTEIVKHIRFWEGQYVCDALLYLDKSKDNRLVSTLFEVACNPVQFPWVREVAFNLIGSNGTIQDVPRLEQMERTERDDDAKRMIRKARNALCHGPT